MKERMTLVLGVCVALLLGARGLATAQEQVTGQEQTKLQKKVEKKLKSDSDLKNNRIEVSVENSVVTLKGKVDTQAERSKAVSLAQIDGVARVDDQLEVGSDGLGAAMSDSAITASVKAKLAADESFKLTQFKVTTNNGVVILEGTVPTESERQRAIEIARTSDGVKRVADKLRVSSAPGGAGNQR